MVSAFGLRFVKDVLYATRPLLLATVFTCYIFEPKIHQNDPFSKLPCFAVPINTMASLSAGPCMSKCEKLCKIM